MEPGDFAEILDIPFFTLEYREGFFKRIIPVDAIDLGKGRFKWKGKLYKLPPGVNEALGEEKITGRSLLSLLNRGPNPLIKKGPRLASGEERLVELRLCTESAPEQLIIEIRFSPDGSDNPAWLPLSDLPRRVIFQNTIYEIIDGKTLEELAETWGERNTRLRVTEGADRRLVLKGLGIPRFADEYGLLVFQFGDQKLKSLLSPDSVFINREELSLVLVRENQADSVPVRPFLAWKDRRYPAKDISLYMDREYVFLELPPESSKMTHHSGGRWVRRADLLSVGIFPLCCFAGGSALEKISLKSGDFLRQSGLRPKNEVLDEDLSGLEILPPEPKYNLPMYQVEEKFSGLSGPSLYSELALTGLEGRSAPFVPLRLLRGNLNIERMDQPERDFYLYWRAEFRRGNIIKTAEPYIRIFARELCLFTGSGVTENFSLLLRLWQDYRENCRTLDSFLPRWLVDFQAIYEIQDFALPLLLAADCDDPLLRDIFLYRRFISENNALSFKDIRRLMPRVIAESVFFSEAEKSGLFPAEPYSVLLIKKFENVINAVDRCLREEFHLRLFEFFCPPSSRAEKREAFAGMERAGHSAYSVTGIRFSMHPPLLGFLENIFRYVEYWFKVKNRPELKAAKPSMQEPWKRIADTALGLEIAETAPGPLKPPASLDTILSGLTQRVKLSESNLKQLRDDSDAVRELLEIEGADDQNLSVVPGQGADPFSPLNSPSPKNNGYAKTTTKTDAGGKIRRPSIKKFITGLNVSDLEAVKIIAAASARRELENLARKNNTMPELLIDRINSAFLEETGDLLIEIVDEKPLIQSEYRQEVLKFLKGKRP